jgi:hypothetical protein
VLPGGDLGAEHQRRIGDGGEREGDESLEERRFFNFLFFGGGAGRAEIDKKNRETEVDETLDPLFSLFLLASLPLPRLSTCARNSAPVSEDSPSNASSLLEVLTRSRERKSGEEGERGEGGGEEGGEEERLSLLKGVGGGAHGCCCCRCCCRCCCCLSAKKRCGGGGGGGRGHCWCCASAGGKNGEGSIFVFFVGRGGKRKDEKE